MGAMFTMSTYVNQGAATRTPTALKPSSERAYNPGLSNQPSSKVQPRTSRRSAPVNVKDIPVLTDLIREK
jgi:hypothetical protein